MERMIEKRPEKMAELNFTKEVFKYSVLLAILSHFRIFH